jgi:hypothetical protein
VSVFRWRRTRVSFTITEMFGKRRCFNTSETVSVFASSLKGIDFNRTTERRLHA